MGEIHAFEPEKLIVGVIYHEKEMLERALQMLTEEFGEWEDVCEEFSFSKEFSEYYDEEIGGEYEKNTGLVIAERIGEVPPLTLPGALVKSHGVFSWGKDADQAVHNAVVIEAVSEMAMKTELINPSATPASEAIVEKHYNRKHGKNAYYGQ